MSEKEPSRAVALLEDSKDYRYYKTRSGELMKVKFVWPSNKTPAFLVHTHTNPGNGAQHFSDTDIAQAESLNAQMYALLPERGQYIRYDPSNNTITRYALPSPAIFGKGIVTGDALMRKVAP